MLSGGSGARIQMMQHQADSVTIVAAPVSGTKYGWLAGATGAGAALGTQSNVRILSLAVKVTWATTQPNPLEVHVTVDGQPLTFLIATPVTATDYFDDSIPQTSPANQVLGTTSYLCYRGFLIEGRSVKVECEITWATTQPTNLTMRVKWAKIP